MTVELSNLDTLFPCIFPLFLSTFLFNLPKYCFFFHMLMSTVKLCVVRLDMIGLEMATLERERELV
jgi:hypothetical protein